MLNRWMLAIRAADSFKSRGAYTGPHTRKIAYRDNWLLITWGWEMQNGKCTSWRLFAQVESTSMEAVNIMAFIGIQTTRARFHSLARFETAGFMSFSRRLRRTHE